jgi:hypothetical protein
MATLLDSDVFRGRGSPAESDFGKMADLEAEFRDLLKTAVADQGKSIQPDILSQITGPAQGPDLSGAFDGLKAVLADLGKDWTLSAPLSTGLVPYDLQAPSKKLFPVLSPLRNVIPRTQGQGTAALAKRIRSISGSGQGTALVNPFHAQGDTASFGGLALQRPPKLNYAADDFSVTYRLQGLSDSVNWLAQWAGQGFEDIRELSNTVLLKGMMLAEEYEILGGRGTGSGQVGAYAAPTATLTAFTAAGSFQGKVVTALANATYFVKVTAEGLFGDGAPSTEVSVATTAQAIQIAVTVDTPGALGYKVYAGTTTNTEKYIGRVGYGGTACFVLGGQNYVTTGAVVPAAADASANAYDGIIPQLAGVYTGGSAGTLSGYYNRLNAQLSGDLTEIQNMFVGLWNANKGDPDEIWVSGADRADISQYVLAAGSLPYRIVLDQGGDSTIGVAVKAIENAATGKVVKVSVHPWLPQGNVLAMSYSLPIASSEIPNVVEIRNVQDYFSVAWPQIQNTFDASIYMYGALVFYAPMFCGLLQGVKPKVP